MMKPLCTAPQKTSVVPAATHRARARRCGPEPALKKEPMHHFNIRGTAAAKLLF